MTHRSWRPGRVQEESLNFHSIQTPIIPEHISKEVLANLIREYSKNNKTIRKSLEYLNHQKEKTPKGGERREKDLLLQALIK